MTEGVDYAFTVIDEQKLYAAGKRFAGRYIGPGSAGKLLTAQERDRIFAAGLDIMLLVEGAANGALAGFSAGVDHARMAVEDAKALGAPDVAMYFAVDFDCTATQWPACAGYLKGAASVIGVNRVGVYGGIRVMQWAARDKVAARFFQTYAWSGAMWFAGNDVEQYRNGVTMAGGTVDLCRSKKDNFGQWSSDDMALSDDKNFMALIWRVQALIANSPVVNGGPTKGEVNQQYYANEAAKATLTPEQLLALEATIQKAVEDAAAEIDVDEAAIAKAVNDDAAARLQG